MIDRTRFQLLAPVLAALSLSCGGAANEAPGGPAGAQVRAGHSVPAAWLAELRAPADVAHQGVRLVELYDEHGRRSAAYREHVVSDGAGRFSLRPIEALTAVATDWTFKQINREGYLFRYRDFAVRQGPWFLANYELSGPLPAEPVAGRAVQRFQAQRRVGAPCGFDVWSDLASGIPLRIEERGDAGVLRARMEYESFDETPDVESTVWFQGVHGERPLDPSVDLSQQVGRAVPRPSLLPAGFRLLEASTLEDEGRTWVKLTYSDGAETFFYLHREPDAEAEVVASAGSEAPYAGDLFLHRMGPAGVAQATLEAGTFIAVGKVSDDELVDAIESALP